MLGITDQVDRALLDDWQRDFPICLRPFDRIAGVLEVPVGDLLSRLRAFRDTGRLTRVGATCAPNVISASTLAAVAAPEDRIEEVAQIIGEERGVNHSYLREDVWNLWFVATGPDRAHVDRALANISGRCGFRVLDLRLVRPFNVDLGFSMRGGDTLRPGQRVVDRAAFTEADRPILQALMKGLPLTETPYTDVARRLGLTVDTVLARVKALVDAGIIARLGIIVRHRALGWRSNAMVVWDMEPEAITEAGPILAAHPGVTLCYERCAVPGIWSYRLYSMIHARSRADARAVLRDVRALPQFRGVRHKALFSLHCYKQTGATVAPRLMEVT